MPLRGGVVDGTSEPMSTLRVIDLGEAVDYEEGLRAMREAMARVDDDDGGPALLLIEHRPTITITRRGGTGAFVSPRERIEADGIAVVEADRGGDVTYHGPGQLTGYPILRLGDTSLGCDVVGFVRAMEQGIIDACRALGVDSAHTSRARTPKVTCSPASGWTSPSSPRRRWGVISGRWRRGRPRSAPSASALAAASPATASRSM